MKKVKKIFQDWAMQGLYESMLERGYTSAKARKEVVARFKAYDEGKDIIFVK